MAADPLDGRRIAQLLASEIDGHEDPPFDRLAVANADRDAEPSPDGTFAYEVTLDGGTIAEVFLHEDRARIEMRAEVESARTAAEDEGLRVRPKAVEPPRLLVFVEDGAEVKRALAVFRKVAEVG